MGNHQESSMSVADKEVCDSMKNLSFVTKFSFDHHSHSLPLSLSLALSRLDTEIDWVAYMEEVSGFLGGEWDYAKLKGQTGPLVYPAGFVYIYSILYYVTQFGKNILLAQYIFLGIYLAFIAVLLSIYHQAKVVSIWYMLTQARRVLSSH